MKNLETPPSDSKSYTLSWHIEDKIVLLSLSGHYRLDDAKEVDQRITAMLDESPSPLSILINATGMNRPHHFSEIRAVQTYMNHHKLSYIYIASKDRLVKLAMMVIFNLSRAHLDVFDDIDSASIALQDRLSDTRR